jgi:peptidoglycan/LPS O-acetylase OafA/YrhL
VHKTQEIYSHTGLRGFAAASVCAAHYIQFHELNYLYGMPLSVFLWQDYAVDLFFILSGFIMSWVYVKCTEKIDWSDYFASRIARITPLYYLTILCLSIVPILSVILHGLKFVGNDFPIKLLANATMISGLINGWHESKTSQINTPAWSVCVEMFLYISVFPILFAINKKIQSKFKISTLIITSVMLTVGITQLYLNPNLFYYKLSGHIVDFSFSFRGVLGFSLGFITCEVFFILRHKTKIRPFINYIIFASFFFMILSRFGLFNECYIIFAFPIIVILSAFDIGVSYKVLNSNIFQWLGTRSYSLYLWHMIVLGLLGKSLFHLKALSHNLLTVIISLLIVLIVSEISFKYFEGPSRRYIKNILS